MGSFCQNFTPDTPDQVGEGAGHYDKPTALSMKTLNTMNPTAEANTMMVWRSSIGRSPCRVNGLAM
jgi:hypothetical protein